MKWKFRRTFYNKMCTTNDSVTTLDSTITDNIVTITITTILINSKINIELTAEVITYYYIKLIYI